GVSPVWSRSSGLAKGPLATRGTWSPRAPATFFSDEPSAVGDKLGAPPLPIGDTPKLGFPPSDLGLRPPLTFSRSPSIDLNRFAKGCRAGSSTPLGERHVGSSSGGPSATYDSRSERVGSSSHETDRSSGAPRCVVYEGPFFTEPLSLRGWEDSSPR